MRRLWRRLFGPRPPAPQGTHTAAVGRNDVAADWCCICLVDLPDGEVWEVREHLLPTGDEEGGGGSWVARTYCREHAPDGALAPVRSRR